MLTISPDLVWTWKSNTRRGNMRVDGGVMVGEFVCACMYVHVQVCHCGSVLTISVSAASTPFLPMGCPAPMTSTWPLVTSTCTCRLQRVNKTLLLSWLKGPNPEIKLHLHVTTLNQVHMFEYWPPGNGSSLHPQPFQDAKGPAHGTAWSRWEAPDTDLKTPRCSWKSWCTAQNQKKMICCSCSNSSKHQYHPSLLLPPPLGSRKEMSGHFSAQALASIMCASSIKVASLHLVARHHWPKETNQKKIFQGRFSVANDTSTVKRTCNQCWSHTCRKQLKFTPSKHKCKCSMLNANKILTTQSYHIGLISAAYVFNKTTSMECEKKKCEWHTLETSFWATNLAKVLDDTQTYSANSNGQYGCDDPFF